MQKNKLNLHIYGIHLLNPYKTVVSHLKIELCVRLSVLRVFHVCHKIGEVYFRLLVTNGFHVKAESERFTDADSPSRQNLQCENFTSSFDRLRQKIAPKGVLHVEHDSFSSFKQ